MDYETGYQDIKAQIDLLPLKLYSSAPLSWAPLFSRGFPHFEVRVRVFETCQWIMKLGTKRLKPKSISLLK